MKRRAFLTASAAAATATAFGLVSHPARAQGSTILTMAYPSVFIDLDPATSFTDDIAVLANVYETLVRYIPGADGEEARLEPLLAESWEASDDGLVWTFKLRPGINFHDGTPLTSSAVKGSIERTKKIGGGAAFIWASLQGIETPDDMTVVFKLNEPQPLDLIASAGYGAWIYAPSTFEQDGAWFNAGNGVGTGPYTIAQFVPGERAVLRRFEGHWQADEAGTFETVNLEMIQDSVLQENLIVSGEADWTYQLPYENLERLQENPALKLVATPSFDMAVGLYNQARPPLNDARVRQALSLAFPYDDVIAVGTAGYAARARGIIPPGMIGYDAEAPIPNTDLGAAQALLAEAGVAPGLILTYNFSAGDSLMQLAGELWRANLQALGITLELQPMSWDARWEQAKSDPASAQDIFVMYWWPTYVTPYDYLLNMFHTEDEPFFNLGMYSNADFDTLVDEANALTGTDREMASAKFSEAQRMLIADSAAVFIMSLPQVHIVRSDIEGYVPNPAYGHVVFADELSR